MSKIDKLIAELYHDGVVFKRLEDCCTLEKGNTPIQKAVAGKYPFVVTTVERRTCNMYQFDKPTVCIPLVSSRGHGVASLNQLYYQEGAFALGNILCGVTPKDSHELSAKFLHCYLNHQKDILIVPLMKGGANVSLTVSSLKKVKVPIPPLDVQNEIVNILSNFENLILELTAELTARKTQYEYYKDFVFFKYIKAGIESVPLSQVADVRDGTHDSPKQSNNGKYLLTSKNVKNGAINYDNAYLISEKDFKAINQRSKVDLWDLLFTMIGTVGEVGMIEDEPDFAIKNVGLIKTGDELLSRFLKYYLTTSTVKKYVENNGSKGSQVFLALGKLRNLPIPRMERKSMQEIVELLNNFNSICTDMFSGIPAEIEARQKQYEYYRHKLLTFKNIIDVI